jgi:hypothetical protein
MLLIYSATDETDKGKKECSAQSVRGNFPISFIYFINDIEEQVELVSVYKATE